MALRDVEGHRRGLVDLTTLSIRDLLALWRSLDPAKADQVRDALREVVPYLVEGYGSAAGALGADFYDEMRDASGAAGSFRASPAPAPSADRVDAFVRWGVGPLYGGDGPDAALSRLTGGLQRLVADVDRDTVELSAASDPGFPTYARHASANACAFCAMLASRGPVYRSAESAGGVVGRGAAVSTNIGRTRGRKAQGVGARGVRGLGSKYHDKCHCVVVPVWGDEFEEAPYVEKWREAYANAPATPGKAIDLQETLKSMRADLGTN